MPYPEEVTRNRLIARRYKAHKHGYKKLGKEFKLHWTTVRDIVQREKSRKAVGEKSR